MSTIALVTTIISIIVFMGLVISDMIISHKQRDICNYIDTLLSNVRNDVSDYAKKSKSLKNGHNTKIDYRIDIS